MTLDVAAVREQHRPVLDRWERQWCYMCHQPWPCETDSLLDALAAEQQRVADLRAALEEAADALEFIRPEITGRWLLAGDQRDQHEGAYRQQHEVVIAARDGARAALAATAPAVEGADER